MEQPEAVPAADNPKSSTGLDLVLYLVFGFGIFLLASYGIAQVFEEVTPLVMALVFAANGLALGGTAYVLGVRRGRISWVGMGVWPARWNWQWIFIAMGLVLILIPIRMASGLVAQLALEGGLESIQSRSELFTVGGLTLSGFILSLVGVGIIAPLSEELFFRGALHGWFQERLRFWPRVLLSSSLFALGHADSAGVVAASFVLGIVNAVAYERSRSLWFPIAIHSVNNVVALVLVYFSLLAMEMLQRLAA